MEEGPMGLRRSKTLTNSAAEWIESRAGPAMLSRHGTEMDPIDEGACEFVPELDRFLPKDQIPEYVHSALISREAALTLPQQTQA